jgi:hypothetical protein
MENKNIQVDPEIIDFVFGDTIKLPLDSLTPPVLTNLQVVENGESEQLVMLNKLENTLLFYDLEHEILIKKIKFEFEGSNGVGKLMSFYVLSADSILLSSKYQVSISDTNGNIISRLKWEDLIKDNPKPHFASIQPIIKGSDSNYYLCALQLGNQTHQSAIKLNLNEGDPTVTHFMDRPSNYKTCCWGDANLDIPYQAYNSNKNHLAYSFPVMSSIYIFDLTTKSTNKYLLNSNYMPVDLKPPFESIEEANSLSPLEYTRVIYQQSFYKYLLYDHYRDVYFRIAWIGMNKEQNAGLPPSNWSSDYVLMVIKGDLSSIKGEMIFNSNKFNPLMMFVTKEGLFIAIKSINDEDNIYFQQCLFIKRR